DEPVDGAFGIVMTVAIARELERWAARTGAPITADDVEPRNLFMAQLGAGASAVDYADAIDRMQAWSRGVAPWWDDHDLLVTPTATYCCDAERAPTRWQGTARRRAPAPARA